jgi:excisionase family DNA binding protein
VEPVLLTVEEAARALHIGRSRVFSLIKSGELVSVKIGHSRRISTDAVRDFARALTKVSP